MGIGGGIPGGTVHAIGFYENDIYVGGNFNFTNSNGQPMISVARFNGTSRTTFFQLTKRGMGVFG